MAIWGRGLWRRSGSLARLNADRLSAVGKQPITIGLLAHPGNPATAKSVTGSAIITYMKSVARKGPRGGPRFPEFCP
jgi:hypothetical protein